MRFFPRRVTLIVLSFVLLAAARTPCLADDAPLKPQIDGGWWQVASNPDLGPLTSPDQQPVDFGIWQAADGTWQIWSCIRSTKEPGHTRLFHRWEGVSLTDPDWKPMGIAMQADTKYGELQGGLQAPYVFPADGHYVMFYGGWEDICSATSTDGKTFDRVLDANGKATLFRSPDGYSQTRDPMVLRIGDLWYCFYVGDTGSYGADFCRTSRDLKTWSESIPWRREGSGRARTGFPPNASSSSSCRRETSISSARNTTARTSRRASISRAIRSTSV